MCSGGIWDYTEPINTGNTKLVLMARIRKFVLFTGGKVRLLKHLYNHGAVTRKKQKFYDSYLGFYFATKMLKDNGLVVCDGTTNDNEKIWTLTGKGVEFVSKVLEIEKIIGELD